MDVMLKELLVNFSINYLPNSAPAIHALLAIYQPNAIAPLVMLIMHQYLLSDFYLMKDQLI